MKLIFVLPINKELQPKVKNVNTKKLIARVCSGNKIYCVPKTKKTKTNILKKTVEICFLLSHIDIPPTIKLVATIKYFLSKKRLEKVHKLYWKKRNMKANELYFISSIFMTNNFLHSKEKILHSFVCNQ